MLFYLGLLAFTSNYFYFQKNAQQSMAAAQKLEASAIGAGHVDSDAAIKLNEAKAESKIRQLSNKLDFLKSQLADDQVTVDLLKKENESHIAAAEVLRADMRGRMLEFETIKRQEVAAAELAVEHRYELHMNELSVWKNKFQMLQSQLQESFHDNEVSKQV